MILNSETLINNFIIKYVNSPTDMISKQFLKKCKYLLPINEECDIFDDKNYVIILSNLTLNEQKMFIRFFQIYLFKVYSVKESFYDDKQIEWDRLSCFLESNKIYKSLFLSCFHYFF
jgi:hypothetical protein